MPEISHNKMIRMMLSKETRRVKSVLCIFVCHSNNYLKQSSDGSYYTTFQKFGFSILFSMDTLHCSKVTVKIFFFK